MKTMEDIYQFWQLEQDSKLLTLKQFLVKSILKSVLNTPGRWDDCTQSHKDNVEELYHKGYQRDVIFYWDEIDDKTCDNIIKRSLEED
jgi:hypothetical protein